MYAFLLILGSVIGAAGLALLASGVSIQDHTFDASNVTPATIAIIGGCILIGLGFVVRALLRVERALIARPMPRPPRVGEAAGSAPQPGELARIPFPPKPKAAPQPKPASIPASPRSAAAEDAAVEAAPVPALERAALERVENTPLVDESDVSLLPGAPGRPDEEKGNINRAAAGRVNGAAHGKAAPALAVSARPARQPKISIFDSLWPKTQRPSPEVQVVPTMPAAPPPAPQPAETHVSSPPAQPPTALQKASASVSILKSGVVEGMAYTLYSDGSIEAQLPGGTLRFGSITELRNHIEQNG